MQTLLISDDADETAVLKVILQRAGFSVQTISSVSRAVSLWTEMPADQILLALLSDHKIPVAGVRQLRAGVVVPILVIVDTPTDDDRAALLEAGADIVISRPFSTRYLIAQTRVTANRSVGVPFFSLPPIQTVEIKIDPANRTVIIDDGPPVRLTNLEFRLMYALMTHFRQIIPVETLVEMVWGYSGDGNRDLVRGLIQRVRAKIEPDPRSPKFILTEPGVGYILRNSDI